MNQLKPLLLEIGTEELPAKSLQKLLTALGNYLNEQLNKNDIDHGKVHLFATPRRLAVLIEDVATTQPSRYIERRGPALSAAFNEKGEPTPACIGFARSCGVEVSELKTQKTDKGEWVYFGQQQEGQETAKLLPTFINNAISQLPIPKPMRWNNYSTQFIRPAHWIVLLLGDEVVDGKILGLKTSRNTFGHRFHHPEAITITNPKEYEKILETKGKVIANFDKRKELIREQLLAKSKALGQIVIDEDLLNEVTGLVEWPTALVGNFDPRFLQVPGEALISAMQSHQKSFPVIDKQEKLLPQFITVSNIESKNPAQVIAGNERVIRARLSDAEFFYNTDLKHSLANYLPMLKNVVFQAKLGSLYDKSERLSHLMAYLSKNMALNSTDAERAGWLAKADLLSTMVGEFPELQGIMGTYYARKDHEPEMVALSLKEQYQPRFAGDDLPTSTMGCALALADRLDTLVGIFGINQAPTGEKDPFGLRRAALGVVRIIIEKNYPLDLTELLRAAKENYRDKLPNQNVINETKQFIMERLRAWYAEQNVSADVFAAVLARQTSQPLDFHHRIKAVQHFIGLSEASALAAANKRVSNILKKQENVMESPRINPNLFEHDAERQLANLVQESNKNIEALCHAGKYTEALTKLAGLQKPVDQFFDHVLVNTEDEKLRQNRLALLTQLRNLFLQIADISLLQ